MTVTTNALGLDSTALAEALVGCLPTGRNGLFNPWREHCRWDAPGNGPEEKLARLAAHLDCEPQWILCGEAPGYQGCRHSGVAFTSEALLMNGAIPRLPREPQRLTRTARPLKEPSATMVWEVLYGLGIAERVVLWNAVQLHPHRPNQAHTNRTPSTDEVALGKRALELLVKAFPEAKLVAVGNKAEGALNAIGAVTAGKVRHPANGGKREFVAGMNTLIQRRQPVLTTRRPSALD